MEKFWRSLKTLVCRISCCAILHFKKDAPGMMLSSKKLPIMVIRNLPIRSWQYAGMLSFVMPVFPKVLHFPQVATSVEVLHWLVVTSILLCWEWIALQWTLKSKWCFQEFAYTSSGCILVGNLSDWIWSYLMDICIVTWCFFNLRSWAFCFAANPTWSMWVVYCNPSDPEAHLECFGRGQRSKWHCHSWCQSFGLVAILVFCVC